MNQQFNTKRFRLVLKSYWAENGRSYLMSIGFTIGIMLLLMLPIAGTPQVIGLLYGLHIFALIGGTILGGCLFTSGAFSAYATSEKGIAAIMIPASQLEKFLVVFLINLISVVLIYTIGLQFHSGIVALANQKIVMGDHYQTAPPELIRFVGFTYFILQGAVFLGSLYFGRNSLLKTLGAVLIITVFAFVFNLFLAYQFTGFSANVFAFPFTFWSVFDGQRYNLSYPPLIDRLIKVFLGLLVMALVFITYVRLKEKEI
ncbi:MAG: hypothetical protein AAF992_25345 [Bacteroidota bacterium]